MGLGSILADSFVDMAAANDLDTDSTTPADVSPISDLPSVPAEPDRPDPSQWSLKHPLSKIQAVVGITAGLISVFGMVVPLAGHIKIPMTGEFVGVVQQARSGQPVLDAAVEISTSQNVIITTLVSKDDGRVHLSLKEGQYRVRVLHPDFASEVRRVQVIGGHSSEVHVALAPRPVPPTAVPVVPVVVVTPAPAPPVAKRPNAVRRFLSGAGPARRDTPRSQTP